MSSKVKEEGQHCDCGGQLDIFPSVMEHASLKKGRCFVCGAVYTVIVGSSLDIRQQKDEMSEHRQHTPADSLEVSL